MAQPGIWRRRWRHLMFAVNGSATRPEQRNWLQRIFRYIQRLSYNYEVHQCSLMACACAYCTLLSLVPLLVIGIFLLSVALGSPQNALHQIVTLIGEYTPNRQFVKDTREMLERIFADQGMLGTFGLLGLLWAAHQIFIAMMPAMNTIWGVTEKRHWTVQRLISLGATFFAIALIGADLALTALLVYIRSRGDIVFIGSATDYLATAAALLLQVLLIAVLFIILYRWLPDRHIPWRDAAIGAGVSAVLWQLTKFGFGFYLTRVNTYDRLYGPLGSLVIIVVWAYFSMTFLLLGAEIAADYEKMVPTKGEPKAQ